MFRLFHEEGLKRGRRFGEEFVKVALLGKVQVTEKAPNPGVALFKLWLSPAVGAVLVNQLMNDRRVQERVRLRRMKRNCGIVGFLQRSRSVTELALHPHNAWQETKSPRGISTYNRP
tara:strand:- start:31378 stop:31728 length:351 start_codon:yes stop_codon:yes gene_type:complete